MSKTNEDGEKYSVHGFDCQVESIVSIDDRGQMVLPKSLRKKLDIKSGDKLALINCERGDDLKCLVLIKASEFESSVKSMIGPLMQELI